MQDRTYLKQKYRKISVALISNFLILGAMAAVMRQSFETNDDIVFAELGSGLRGVKDAHLVFQNYGLGMIYRLLYGVTGRLPWYTIVQYMILFAAFTVVTYVLISRLGEISVHQNSGDRSSSGSISLTLSAGAGEVFLVGDCRRDFTGGHRLYVQRGSVLGKLWTDGRGRIVVFVRSSKVSHT